MNESDEKYTVFRTDDLNRAMDARDLDGSAILRALAPHVVPDAVVIRRQDRFAANALDTYADQILALVELSEDHPLIDLMPAGTKDRLMSIADFFRDQAHMSRNEQRKLPD